MPKRPDITIEFKKAAVARLAKEMRIDVAKDLNIDPSTLGKWRGQFGAEVGVGKPKPIARYDEATRAKVLARIAKGEKRTDVAAELGIDPATISSWKSRYEGTPKVAGKAKEILKNGKPRVKPYHERRQHTDEFKQAAVDRVLAGERVIDVAADLDIQPSMITVWRKSMPKKRSYVRRAPELPGTDRTLLKSVSTAIGLLRQIRGQCNNTDPVHLTAMLVLMTLEGKM